MKRSFLAGLAILLPVIFTLMIFLFVINLLTKPFIGIVEGALSYYNLLNKDVISAHTQDVLIFFSRFLIIIFMFLSIVGIGLLGRLVIFHYIFKLGNYVMHRIPFINKIYKAVQDVTKTIFTENQSGFSQVVLVPFPTPEQLCVGFITNDSKLDQPITDPYGNISVFVPATPNPTIGFVLLYKKEQMIFMDMTVEEGLKYVVSCGVLSLDSLKKKN